ncbi:hypothetical protein NEHOM01_2194 [Nematocida homosporus]|uniref:uncharacterized protein n=1 Tax=Nematocida homosporus TaxID=1912981 RepID=UPI00221F0BED|nr:uncharacterized protein NEHOM01_2194 [Nematocida homosporus]KAI5187458.1 hypothetical protein NEHOM01_2194 [Nematocida homosporus]
MFIRFGNSPGMGVWKSANRCLRYVGREFLYVKRALLLRPLVEPGKGKPYSFVGLISNVISFSLLVLLSSSIYKTVLVDGWKGREKSGIYLAINASVVPFWSAVACGSLVYRGLFDFELLEAAYVIIYSVTTSFPIMCLGKLLMISVVDPDFRLFLLGGVRVLAALLATCFVAVNAQCHLKSKIREMASLCLALCIQVIFVCFSEMTPQSVVTLAKIG